jgi:hypothetical protein
VSLVGVRGVTSFSALGIVLTDDDQDFDDDTIAQLRRAAQFAGVLLTVNGVEDQSPDTPGLPGDGPVARTVKVVGELQDGASVVYSADLDAYVSAPNAGTWA